MNTVSLSLWLPVSRTNFFSVTASDWLRLESDGPTATCTSTRLAERTYVPLLQVGVLRRVLEVMPRSFGYAPAGRCTMRGDGYRGNVRSTSR